MEQFSKEQFVKIDARLSALETQLAVVGANVKHVQDRAHVWDTFQHHVTSWSALMTSTDSKMDHLSRSQLEHQSAVINQLNAMREFQTQALKQQSKRLDEAVEAVKEDPATAFTKRGVLATLQSIEDKVANMSSRQRFRQTPHHVKQNIFLRLKLIKIF